MGGTCLLPQMGDSPPSASWALRRVAMHCARRFHGQNNRGPDSQASGRGASGKAQPHPTAEGSRATRVWESAGRAGLQGRADCVLCHEAPPHRSPFLYLEPWGHGEGLVWLHVMGNLGGVGPSRPMLGPPSAEDRHRSMAHPALKGQGAAARKPAGRPALPRLGSEALPLILLRLSQSNVSGKNKKVDYHAGFDCLQGKAILTHARSFLQPRPAHS